MRERGEKEGGEEEGGEKEGREEGGGERGGERGGKGGEFDEQLHYDRKLGGRLRTMPGQLQQCTC